MTKNKKNNQGNSEELPPVTGLTEAEKAIFSVPPPKIAGYRIVRALGEGGMGMVYLADQQEPIRRRVALKVIKPGMDSRQVVARFEAERQALALLDHANIAQVFDAGLTDDGRPYFAMEYVEGSCITEYCDDRKLSIDHRLQVFISLCDTVQHAHQKGIIHRDIKPSNILVQSQGGNAVPKIIDFGVAKAISQPLTQQTLFTEQGQLIGTPEYMSPEQAEVGAQDVDTRTDIYSLGAVLYELLTGVLPFERKAFQKAGFSEIQRIIRKQDPPRPSTRLTNLAEAGKEIAEKRRTTVAGLAKRLHKELEWIPLKAMRKEPDHRYRTASELADDIRSYLAGNPLTAGPESATYRFKKFVRRNRTFVTSVAAVLTVLVAGAIVSTFFAVGQARANKKLIWENYAATLGIIQMRVNEGLFPRAREMLHACPVGQRGWEWGRLMRQCSPELLTIRTNELEDRPVGSLHNAVFTPDQRYILDDRPGLQMYSLLDLQTAETVRVSRQYLDGGWKECTRFMHDGKCFSYCSGRHTVDIINLETNETVRTFDSGKGTLRTFVVSPNGKLAAGYVIVEKTGERQIVLWDAETAAELNRFQMENADTHFIHQSESEEANHENRSGKGWWVARLIDPVGRVLGFLPDNQHIVYADDHLTILDTETGQRKHLTPCRSWPVAYSSKTNLAAIFSLSTQRFELWNVVEGVKMLQLDGPPHHHFLLAITDDTRFVATGDTNSWDLWCGHTGRHIRKYPGGFESMAFSPSGNCAITTSLSEIKVWSTLEERNMEVKPFVDYEFKPVDQAFVDRNNGVHTYGHNVQLMATADLTGDIYLWKVPSMMLIKRWKCHDGEITGITFSADDKLIATTSVDGTAKIWRTSSTELLHTIPGVAGRVSKGAAFSTDGKRLAVGAGGQYDSKLHEIESESEVRIFDVETGKLLATVAETRLGIDLLAYSPDGKWLVVGSGYGGGVAGVITVLDAQTGRRSFGEITDVGETRYVSFSRDGRYMLALGMTLQPVLWDFREQRELWRLENAEALHLSFHPDGRRFVTVCRDKVAIHATSDGREIISLGYGWPPAAFGSDGRKLIYRQNETNTLILHSDDWAIPTKKAALQAALRDVRQELASAR